MNSYFVDSIIKALGSQVKDKEKAREVLHKEFRDTDAVTWTVGDILTEADSQKRKVTKQDARNILATMVHKHDAELGITWDTIAAALSEYPKKK